MRLPAAILIAVLLLAGCTGPAPQGGGAVQPPSAVQGGPSAGSGLPECLASCRGLGAMAEQCRYGCYLNDARGSKDPASCDALESPSNASDFYASCLGGVAASSGTVAPCWRGRNSSERDWCILTASEYIKDTAICSNVTDKTIRDACIQAAGMHG